MSEVAYIISPRGITRLEGRGYKLKPTKPHAWIDKAKVKLPAGSILGSHCGVVWPLIEETEFNFVNPIIAVSKEFAEKTRQEFDSSV